MHYVMSDLHGCYREYLKMLELINFSTNDVLYINGDVIDRGPYPIDILSNMMRRSNIIPIIGNHEWMALPELLARTLASDKKQEDKKMYDEYVSHMHETTFLQFDKLCTKNQMKIIEYVSEFSAYQEVCVNKISYIILHAGLDWKGFDPKREIEAYQVGDLVWADTHYDKIYYPDKIMVTGHTPTYHIDRNYAGKIYKANNHIAIDCGCVFGGNLGCYCLETEEEFYVPRILG